MNSLDREESKRESRDEGSSLSIDLSKKRDWKLVEKVLESYQASTLHHGDSEVLIDDTFEGVLGQAPQVVHSMMGDAPNPGGIPTHAKAKIDYEKNARLLIDLVPPLWHKYKDLHAR